MSTFPYASPQYARALLDESAPGEERVLDATDLFTALGVPSALIPYLSEVEAPRSTLPEGLAIEMLRWLRGQPRACIDDIFECVRLSQAGPQALDFAVSDPWLRYVLGVWMLTAAKSDSENTGVHLAKFDMSESDEAARAYMTAETDRPWALYMAGAWVLDRADLVELWLALMTAETAAARQSARSVLGTLRYPILVCAYAWSEHVQACVYEHHYGNTDRVNVPSLVASEDPYAADKWCQEILGSDASYPRGGHTRRTALPRGSDVALPGSGSFIWTRRYITWMAAMCDATAMKISGLPEAPRRLPCLRGSDPEAAQVVAFGKQMMQWADDEAAGR